MDCNLTYIHLNYLCGKPEKSNCRSSIISLTVGKTQLTSKPVRTVNALKSTLESLEVLLKSLKVTE